MRCVEGHSVEVGASLWLGCILWRWWMRCVGGHSVEKGMKCVEGLSVEVGDGGCWGSIL